MKADKTDFYLRTAFHGNLPESIEGNVGWQSPSNIALVKYWGKHGDQLPNNPSISLTLSEAHTKTSIQFKWKKDSAIRLNFSFEGIPYPMFGQKIECFLKTLLPFFPFLAQLELNVNSWNTFPHSSGIASSASSMSALVMCLIEIEQQVSGLAIEEEEMLRKASFFSRIGSGSASRSVFPYASIWGRSEAVEGSAQEYAFPMSGLIHPVFKGYRDSILIIHAGTKEVSSRVGHALMDNNPFASVRYQQANDNIHSLVSAMKQGDLEKFIAITESEALQLHALMMTSNPSFILMQPGTLAAIASIRRFRNETGIPVCFTLDAGPNIHLLYPHENDIAVKEFMQSELTPLCANGSWIDDKAGDGPSKLAIA